MADVVVETYEICLGTGPSDPALVVYIPGIVSQEKARGLLRAINEARRVDAFEPALFAAGAEFFIRTAPGTQTAVVSDVTRSAILEELATHERSIALFARHSNPTGFTRVGSAPASVIARISAER